MLTSTPLNPKGTVSFRIIENEDRAFLFDLYKSTRADEMAHAIMSEGDKEHFLEGQFAFQSEGYATQFIGAVHRIIQLDGTDIGRLIVLRTDELCRVIDLSILPAYRGRGIGSDILGSLINEAHGGKVPLRLKVESGNRATTFYARLGFRTVAREGHHLELEWYRPHPSFP